MRLAADGGQVIVTMHGRPVARLVAFSSHRDPLADLRARGLVSDPEGDWQPHASQRVQTERPVSELVAEQRR